MPSVQAEPWEDQHKVTLLLEVNPKQIGQLFRDWHAVVDVTDVRAGAPLKEAAAAAGENWGGTPHPSASVLGREPSQSASA